MASEYQLNSGELERIERFMNSYWKTHEFLFETTRKYNNFLRRKYGREIVNEFHRIARLVSRGNKKAYHELNDFVFRTGLCDDVPKISLRGRETLKSLLAYLAQENKSFTLADFGSGDGKIAIGLTSYLDALERLYAIDITPFAFERMEINIQNLAQEEQEKVRRKIVSLQGDYTSEELQDRLLHHEPNGVDIALAAYPRHLETILPILSRLTKPDGKIITCYPQDMGNMMYTPFLESDINDNLTMIEERQNEIGKEYGLRFGLNHVWYLPWEMIIVSVGERVR